MEVLPCSRVAHIERTRKPYNNDIDYYAKRNALRAAEVWMDGFKSHVYMAWNIPMTVSRAGAGGGVAGDGSQSRWGPRPEPGQCECHTLGTASPVVGPVWERALNAAQLTWSCPVFFGRCFSKMKVTANGWK